MEDEHKMSEGDQKPENAPIENDVSESVSAESEEENESGIDVEKTSEEELLRLIEAKDRKGLLEIFDKVPTIDIAEAATTSPLSVSFIFSAASAAP